MKTLTQDIGTGRQDVIYTETLRDESGRKFRVSIRSDHYAFQSHAKISVFDPASGEWNVIESIHHSLMATPASLNGGLSTRVVPAAKFKADRDTLVKRAAALYE